MPIIELFSSLQMDEIIGKIERGVTWGVIWGVTDKTKCT